MQQEDRPLARLALRRLSPALGATVTGVLDREDVFRAKGGN
jgi:hypothetical protein